MKVEKISNQFKKGHTYFSQTRAGKIRKFEAIKVFKNSRTGERTSLIARYDGKPEQRYEIKKSNSGFEYVLPDKRFCTVIDTLEIIDEIEITDSMISEVHEFNNSGQCIVTIDGKAHLAKWNHGEVEADQEIKEAFWRYMYA